MKRIGPWTEPWGTPQVRSKGDDYYFIYCYYLCPTFLSLRLLFLCLYIHSSVFTFSLLCLYIHSSLTLHLLFSVFTFRERTFFTFTLLCLYILSALSLHSLCCLYIHSALSLHSHHSVFTFSPLCLYILTVLFLDVFWTVVVEPP